MFKELVPLLRNRVVLMTLALVEDDNIRVSVVPKKIKEDENDALTIPVSITGTAEDLETRLGSELVRYTGSHLQLASTLVQAQAEMDAAAKAAKAEAQSKSKSPVKKETAASTSAKPSQTVKPAEPVKPASPRTASLFDMPAVEQPMATLPLAAVVESEGGDEDEILDEIRQDDAQEEDDVEHDKAA
jgi:PRTRC genetic system protein E